MRAHCFVVGLLVLAGCPDSDSDSQASGTGGDSYCESCNLETQTVLLLGDGAQDCGAVGPMSDPTAVNECLRAALGVGSAFGEYELQGIDSSVANRWLVDEAGNVTRLSFDSNVCGGAGGCDDECGPRISTTDCGPGVVDPSEATDPFACNSTDSTTLCGPPN